MAVILLVEDEEIQRRALEATLRGAGHQILLAGNGAMALALARDKKPDVLITDLAMPKMDGRELCQSVRASPGLEGMHVIVITALEGEAPRSDSLLAGADDFLRKPVVAEDLLQRVALGASMRSLRAEAAALRERSGQAVQTQEILAGGLDTALRGLEEGLARLNAGDPIAAMKALRQAHETVRAGLARIPLPEN